MKNQTLRLLASSTLLFAVSTSPAALAQGTLQSKTDNPRPVPASSTPEQGLFFAKKTYTKRPIPTYPEIRSQLPQPIYEENPRWVEVWWKAWELAFKHFYEPEQGSGFVSPYFDAAFSSQMFLWDGSFITMFTNYAHPMISSIEGLDNFYRKQHPTGEICREINRKTGKDYSEWVNTRNQTLSSSWGFGDGSKKNQFIPVKYIGRSVPTPNPVNTLDALNHPILAWAEWESYKITGNKSRLALVWEPLVKYYEALQKYIRQGNGLYITDWASMDNSSRNSWLHSGGTGIDISAEMVLFAKNLAAIAAVLDKTDLQKFYLKESGELSELINAKMWNEKTGFYFDLNLKEEQCSIKTVAGFWPLIAQVASPHQAKALSAHLQNPKTFGAKYPVPTLARDEKDYSSTGSYWLGANWAPTNTMVIRGLEQYGYDALAYSIAIKHLEQVADIYQKTETIWENYSADFLQPGKPAQRDFVGWSGMAPIAYLLEYAIGLKADATVNTLTWNIRSDKKTGCRNYRFNGHTVSLLAEVNDKNKLLIEVNSDSAFILELHYGKQSLKKEIIQGRKIIEISLER
jgi:hypothetical protein